MLACCHVREFDLGKLVSKYLLLAYECELF